MPEIKQENWNAYYYVIAKTSTPETKMHFFQYKILHKIHTTNSKLFYSGIKENNRCTFCHLRKESIIHLFWDCTYVNGFCHVKIQLDIINRGLKNGENFVNCVIL
jgi:hypothetical protein